MCGKRLLAYMFIMKDFRRCLPRKKMMMDTYKKKICKQNRTTMQYYSKEGNIWERHIKVTNVNGNECKSSKMDDKHMREEKKKGIKAQM